jgi:hypothetical protein
MGVATKLMFYLFVFGVLLCMMDGHKQGALVAQRSLA